MSSAVPEGIPEPHPAKAVMARRRITVKAVAEHLGMHQVHVSKVLNNYRGASPTFRAGVCQLLGLPESELFLVHRFGPPGRNHRWERDRRSEKVSA